MVCVLAVSIRMTYDMYFKDSSQTTADLNQMSFILPDMHLYMYELMLNANMNKQHLE